MFQTWADFYNSFLVQQLITDLDATGEGYFKAITFPILTALAFLIHPLLDLVYVLADFFELLRQVVGFLITPLVGLGYWLVAFFGALDFSPEAVDLTFSSDVIDYMESIPYWVTLITLLKISFSLYLIRFVFKQLNSR